MKSKRITGTPVPKVGKAKKKLSISKLKKKLWETFSLYIRKRDKGICFTCGRYAEGSGYHAGHFVPKSVGGLTLYFDEENVNGQCYNCNINLSGNQYEYAKRLGIEKAEELLRLKHATFKVDIYWYEKKILEYKDKLGKLED